jgi:hypothetical protein
MPRSMYLVTGVSALLALSIACGRQNAAPLSPTGATPASGDEVAGPAGETLKIAAPTLVSPTGDTVLESATATLVCTVPATAQIALAYDFELYDASNVKIRTEVVAGTTWVVQGLEFEGHYTWRVRGTASYLDAGGKVVPGYGPWSGFGSFQTPANRGYIRGNELFDPLTNNGTIGAFNDVTFLPGQGVRLNGIESFVEWKLAAPLTDGQFSVSITGLRNSNEQWKSKVMSMLKDDGVNITDNIYRFTADRRNRDSSGTIRYTLRSRGVDAGEPVCGSASWDAAHLYLWTYTWAGGNSNLRVQDGGPAGAVMRSCGARYTAPYAPNPHIIRLGSIGGRGGSETLPGAIFRNVWVSANPRPVLPGDTP